MSAAVLYHGDSFKSGTSLSDLTLGRWNGLTNPDGIFSLQSGKGRFGGQSLQISHAGNINFLDHFDKTIGAQSVFCLNFPMRVDALPAGSSASYFFQFLDGSTVQISLRINLDGTLTLLRGGASGGTVLASSSVGLSVGVYYVLELKVTFHATTGVYELKIVSGPSTGSIIGPTTSANTSASSAAQATAIRYGSDQTQPKNGCILQLEHSMLLDDFLGDKQMIGQLPSSNPTAIWTPNASTNLSRVQEAQEDGDTSYVSSSTPGDIDYYGWPALPTGTKGIFAVVNSMWHKKTAAGTNQIRSKVKQGSTIANAATINPSTTYAEQLDVTYVDPITTVALVKSDADSLLTGIERVA